LIVNTIITNSPLNHCCFRYQPEKFYRELVLQFFFTGQTTPVNTDGPATLGATPPFGFGFDEVFQTEGFNVFEIFEHAHVVLCPVTLVELL